MLCMVKVLVVCNQVYQSTLAGAIVTPAKGEDRNDSKHNGQRSQDAEQLQVAKFRESRKSFGHAADQRAAHQLEPVSDGHDKANRTKPCGEHLEREDRAAEKIERTGY